MKSNNFNADEKARHTVAKSSYSSVEEALAECAEDSRTLAELAKDEDCYVRWAVAENTKTDTATLAELAKDENRFVRWAVARNEKTDTATLAELAKDEDSNVRYAVAENAKNRYSNISRACKG